MTVALLWGRHVPPVADSFVARAVLWVASVAMLLGLAAGPALAADEGESRFVWDEVSVTVRLQDDGTTRVREHDTVRFFGGPFRQGCREIPLAAIDDISQVTVTEVGSGPAQQYLFVRPGSYSRNAPHTYTFQQVGTVMRIEWSFSPTTSATRAWVIEYTAGGVLRVHDDAQPYEEIWWTGVDRELTRDAPVTRATLIFILPRPVDPGATIAESNGTSFGGEDGLVWFWRAENLKTGDTLEASLRFPPLIGTSKPSWQDTRDRQSARDAPANLAFLGLALLTAVGGSVGLLAAWWTRGRDPLPGPIPERLAEPPDDTPPGVVGALLDERVDQREYVATLIDLGRRGVVRTTTLAQPDLSNRRRMVVTLLQPDAEMAPYEWELLFAFFARSWWRRAQVHLPLDDPGAMQEALKCVEKLLYGELVQRGFFARRPPGTREVWRYAGIVLWATAVAVLLVGMVVVSTITWPLLASVALVALGAAVFVLSQYMPQKTRAGAEAAARWRAFRSYMEAIDRLDALQSGQDGFERYLPYAVAFGIEEPWIDAFARAQTTGAPQWYDVVNLDGNWMNSAVRAGARMPLPVAGLTDLGALQNVSTLASSSLQASSDTLFDLFNEAGEAFSLEKALRSTNIDGTDIALRVGISIVGAALGGGKGGGSGGGGGGFS